MADAEQQQQQVEQQQQHVGEAVRERRGPQYVRMCLKCAEITHTTRQCAFYKTQWCRHEQRGGCHYKWKCKYVHDVRELRPTTQEWCVKFVFENGEGKFYGCRSPRHAYSSCPERTAVGEDTAFQRLAVADFVALVVKSPAE